MNCSNELGFVHHFEENMKALGLPAPTTIYTSSVAIIAAVKSMSDIIGTYGRSASLTQLAMRATWGFALSGVVSRVAGIVLALRASYYVGACIGSAAVATRKSMGCGTTTVADVMNWARKNGIYESWIEGELLSNPQILARIA